MTLQVALLLIGTIVVIVVALTAYDKGRLAKSMRRGLMGLSPARAPDVPDRREPVVPPGGKSSDVPFGDPDRKFLKSDLEVPPPPPVVHVPLDPLAHALGDIEEIANRPLNLNPGFDPPGTGPEAAQKRGVHTEPNEAIDFVIQLPGPGPVGRRSALSIYKQNEYKLEYPRELYGRRYQTNFWSVLQHDSEATQYSDLKLAIQLIDSPGPIGESELHTFVQVGLKLADALHRPAKFSIPFEQAIARARELQRFYDEHDVIAGVNVASEPHAPLKGRAIVSAMENAGLELAPTGVYQRLENSRVLYSVANQTKPGIFNASEWDTFRTTGLALYMSVPTVPEPTEAFDRMMATAKATAAFLGASLVDQEQRPLTDKGIAAIRAQIRDIDAKMRAFGIAPGSEAAFRLFAAD